MRNLPAPLAWEGAGGSEGEGEGGGAPATPARAHSHAQCRWRARGPCPVHPPDPHHPIPTLPGRYHRGEQMCILRTGGGAPTPSAEHWSPSQNTKPPTPFPVLITPAPWPASYHTRNTKMRIVLMHDFWMVGVVWRRRMALWFAQWYHDRGVGMGNCMRVPGLGGQISEDWL